MKEEKLKVSIKSLVSIRFNKYIPRLVLHEKYEKYVKWFLRIATCIGIISSLIAFSNKLMSFSFALFLVVIEQFFEKAIFKYTSIYVQPFPNFRYKPEEWKGMAFAFPNDSDPKLLNVIGCAFVTENYAQNFFKLFQEWNYNKTEDKENNVCISFIIENKKNYSVYIYPNFDRKSVVESFREIEELNKFQKFGKEHQQLVFQMIYCKTFPFGSNSQLEKFVYDQSKNLLPFWFKPFIIKKNGELHMLYKDLHILKHHFKYKNRSELNKDDYEYHHGKNIMKL